MLLRQHDDPVVANVARPQTWKMAHGQTSLFDQEWPIVVPAQSFRRHDRLRRAKLEPFLLLSGRRSYSLRQHLAYAGNARAVAIAQIDETQDVFLGCVIHDECAAPLLSQDQLIRFHLVESLAHGPGADACLFGKVLLVGYWGARFPRTRCNLSDEPIVDLKIERTLR
jgi:hypothetical protein